MLKVVLYQPEIPPNTGNIIRLCANSGCSLHLIEPLGFSLEDKKLRRAGLDYREFAPIRRYPDFQTFRARHPGTRLFGLSTRGTLPYHQVTFRPGDALLFGPETRGLPTDILALLGRAHCIRIPMSPDSRSLNLSNAAAVVVYEGLRQLGFPALS
jgi:tRNA (cytidine/uridine-2'-O-)-methyltransferase